MSNRRPTRTVKVLLSTLSLGAFAFAALGVAAVATPAPDSSTTVIAGNTWSRTPVGSTDRSSWSTNKP